MTDNRAAAEAAFESTTLHDEGHSEKPLSDAAFEAKEPAQAPKDETKPEGKAKPESTRETVSKTLRDLEAKDKADEEAKAKPKDGEKAEKGKDEAPEEGVDAKVQAKQPEGNEDRSSKESSEGTEREADRKPKQSEGKAHQDAPARFLPEAREKWQSTPREVKAEIHRIEQEREQELSTYRQSHEEWGKLDKFKDHYARTYNASVGEALERYTNVDTMLRQNPVAALREILSVIGLTPEQYAQHVIQNPDAHKAQVPQPQQPRQQNPEMAALRAEIQAMRSEQANSRVLPVIEAFAAKHPDYHALEPKMAEVLGSGVIDKIYGTGLSPEQKLSEAYRMVGGRIASSHSDPELPAANSRPVDDQQHDPAGQKSIKGASPSGFEPSGNKRVKSNRDAAAAALAELGL